MDKQPRQRLTLEQKSDGKLCIAHPVRHWNPRAQLKSNVKCEQSKAGSDVSKLHFPQQAVGGDCWAQYQKWRGKSWIRQHSKVLKAAIDKLRPIEHLNHAEFSQKDWQIKAIRDSLIDHNCRLQNEAQPWVEISVGYFDELSVDNDAIDETLATENSYRSELYKKQLAKGHDKWRDDCLHFVEASPRAHQEKIQFDEERKIQNCRIVYQEVGYLRHNWRISNRKLRGRDTRAWLEDQWLAPELVKWRPN